EGLSENILFLVYMLSRHPPWGRASTTSRHDHQPTTFLSACSQITVVRSFFTMLHPIRHGGLFHFCRFRPFSSFEVPAAFVAWERFPLA
ncbi:MAG: hypothetical protein ACKPKO_50120, partial [Candidatus Fonsibacter sp.]